MNRETVQILPPNRPMITTAVCEKFVNPAVAAVVSFQKVVAGGTYETLWEKTHTGVWKLYR